MAVKTRRKANVAGKICNFDDDVIRLYMNDVNRIPVLSREEEGKLAEEAVKGSKAAMDKIVNANLRFVITIAKKYQGMGLPFPDLISEGNIGLINAVKHFNIEKGYRFITYAVWWIRQSIIVAINEKGRMIRLPLNKNLELKRIENTKQESRKNPGMESDTETGSASESMDVNSSKAVNLVRVGQEVISLDEPASTSEDAASLMDYIEDESNLSPVDAAMNSVLKDKVEILLGKLKEKDAEILRCRFGLGDNMTEMSLQEIGLLYNLSRERIRQIEKKAIGQIEFSKDRKMLEGFMA